MLEQLRSPILLAIVCQLVLLGTVMLVDIRLVEFSLIKEGFVCSYVVLPLDHGGQHLVRDSSFWMPVSEKGDMFELRYVTS